MYALLDALDLEQIAGHRVIAGAQPLLAGARRGDLPWLGAVWPEVGAVFIGGAGSGRVVDDVPLCAATSDGPAATIRAASAIRVNMGASICRLRDQRAPRAIVPPLAWFQLSGGLRALSRFEKAASIRVKSRCDPVPMAPSTRGPT
jgi:hypothetical protein